MQRQDQFWVVASDAPARHAAPRAGAEDRSARAGSLIETGMTLAGAAVGLVGIVYVIGGAVMWLRFQSAGLPADRAVALVPRTELLVIGLRVMILPAVLASALFLALARLQRARAARLEALREMRGRAVELAASTPGNGTPEEPAMGPDELDPAIKFLEECLKGERWAPRADRGRLQVAVVAVFSIAFALVVPLSFGAFAWPVVAFGLLTYWRRLQRRFSPPASEGGMLWRLGVATVIASAVISVARQCDPPVQLPSVTIKLAGKPVAPGARGPATASASAGAPAGGADERQRAGDAPPRTVTGILVTLTDENVAIGDADEGTITTYPRSRVTDLEIGPPLDRRSPPRSLLSSLMGGQAWGWTPLEFWCGGERYGWPRVADLCKGAPTVGLRTLTLEDGQVRGLRVLCPEAADRTCRGFLTLETVSPRQDPESGRRLPVQIEPVEFNVAQDDSAKVPLEVDQRRAERLLSGQEDARIRVRVRLTLDRAGDAVVFDGVRMLAISRLDNSRPDRLDRTPPQSADEPDRDARDGAAAGGPRTDPGADDPVGGGASEADRETDRPGGASEADRETDRPGGASPTGGEAAAEERASEGSPLPPSPDERLIIPADPSAAAP